MIRDLVRRSWYIFSIFEAAKFSSLSAFLTDLLFSPESAFSKIQNDNLLVCELSRIVVDLTTNAGFRSREILM